MKNFGMLVVLAANQGFWSHLLLMTERHHSWLSKYPLKCTRRNNEKNAFICLFSVDISSARVESTSACGDPFLTSG